MKKNVFRKSCILGITVMFVGSGIAPSLSGMLFANEPDLKRDYLSNDTVLKEFKELIENNNELQQHIKQLLQYDFDQWLTISAGVFGVHVLFPPKLPRLFLCPRGLIFGMFAWRKEGFTLYMQLDDLLNMTLVNGTHAVLIMGCIGYSANIRPRIVGLGGGFVAISAHKPLIKQRTVN